jgi:hypothetical protein
MTSHQTQADGLTAEIARAKIAEVNRKTACYEALIDAGADRDEVAGGS